MNEVCPNFQDDIENTVPKAIAQEILSNLYNQKASGRFCDVQFLHGSATLWAHSCVLASYSPFLMRLFNKYAEENISWSFNKPMQVNISSVSKCNGSSRNNCVFCTCKIIDFIYTGKIKLDPDHLDHVINLSNNLEIEVLLLICQRYKRDHFTLLDSLSKSNQICNGNTSDDLYKVKAYVEHLYHSISNGSYRKVHTSHIQCDSSIGESTLSDLSSTCKTMKKNNVSHSQSKQKSLKILNLSEPTTKTNYISEEENLPLKKEYVCTACNFKSFNNFKFKQHKKVFHKRNYVCLDCDYTTFKMAEVLEHLLKSSHGGRTCSVCLFEAESNSSLHSHFNDHSKSYPFRCSLCKQRFKYRNDWVRHKYSPYHEKELYNSIEKLKISPQEEEKQNHACRICKYEFSSGDLLQKHSHIFHKRKYICLSCDFNTFKIDSIIEHLIENEHDENVCSICLFVANTNYNLKDHLLDHKKSQPFSCSVCRSRFQTRNEWWRHELAHGTDKPFKCQYCELSFQTSPYLKTHILYRHKKKKHKCDICGYGAPFASKLEKHSLIHNNKFKCKINDCTFDCSSEINYKKHKKEHEVDCSSEINYKKHKKGHEAKPLSCPMCNLRFKFEKNLNRHIRLSHTSQNSLLTCPLCSYSNNRIDKMKEHCKNIHAGDNDVIEAVSKQNKDNRMYGVTEIIKKQRRLQTVKEKSYTNHNTTNVSEMDSEKVKNILDSSENRENHFVGSSINDSLKQTVLLSEATSELNILCENEGKPIPVASVIATNMVTIGNFREGTGTVTLNEATGVLTLNNINVDSKGAVFLNESTGVLSYINLNIENAPESNIISETHKGSEQVQLNEVTGEIITVKEDCTISSKKITEDDFPFDAFGVDFNEDSWDGFDEFDSLFFNTFSPIDSNSSHMEELLKNNTNELFSDCESIPRLDEMTGELTFDKNKVAHQCNISAEDMWSVNSFPDNSIIESVPTEVYESLLNEVTGELS